MIGDAQGMNALIHAVNNNIGWHWITIAFHFAI